MGSFFFFHLKSKDLLIHLTNTCKDQLSVLSSQILHFIARLLSAFKNVTRALWEAVACHSDLGHGLGRETDLDLNIRSTVCFLAVWSTYESSFPVLTTLCLNFDCCLFSSKVTVSQLCPILCDPKDCIVSGILQARILQWVAFPFSRGSPQPRDWTQVSHIAGRFFTSWATREAQEYLSEYWKKSYDKPRQCIKKQRYHFADKGLCSQSYGLSNNHGEMWELNHKEGWVLKN